jgi:hypothetical protein
MARTEARSTTMWLYQINQELWSPRRLRLELWEGERWSWPTRKFRSAERPEPGDTVVFYCAKSGSSDPGFYGWAVVTEFYDDAEVLYFTPVAPSDYLKMTPWWDDAAEALADRIRGNMKQATLWSIDREARDELRAGIRRWLSGNDARQ